MQDWTWAAFCRLRAWLRLEPGPGLPVDRPPPPPTIICPFAHLMFSLSSVAETLSERAAVAPIFKLKWPVVGADLPLAVAALASVALLSDSEGRTCGRTGSACAAVVHSVPWAGSSFATVTKASVPIKPVPAAETRSPAAAGGACAGAWAGASAGGGGVPHDCVKLRSTVAMIESSWV